MQIFEIILLIFLMGATMVLAWLFFSDGKDEMVEWTPENIEKHTRKKKTPYDETLDKEDHV